MEVEDIDIDIDHIKKMNDTVDIITNIKNPNQGLSDFDIKTFFKQKNIPFNELKSLQEIPNAKKSQAIVYTGREKDEINNGNSKHWLYYYKSPKGENMIFDSYGDPKAYNKEFLDKNNVKFINPYQLQSWNTNVCGPYVCSFAETLNSLKENNPDKLLQNYLNKFNFSYNTNENDHKVQQYYNKTVENN